jgi:hypothetical protein
MSSSPSKADKRLLIASVIIFVATCIGAVIVLQSRTGISSSTPPTATSQANTTGSAIASDLTQLPQATPLAGELAEKIDAIEALIKDCPDYTNERRAQIAQHIAWLREPATLPEEMIIALGGNANEGLLRGLGTFTLSDWGLKDQPPDSCLLPIGQQINALIVAAGGEAIPAFEGVAE